MKKWLLAIIGLLPLVNVQAGDWRGYVELEGTAFFENPAFADQSNSDLSIAAQPEYLQEWNEW